MLCDKPVKEYILVSVDEVNARLEQGYQLYGPAKFVHCADTIECYQVLVRIRGQEKITSNETPFKLKPIEAKCIELLIAEYSSKEIAATLHRSYRTIDKVLANLCEKFNCRRRSKLLLSASNLGFIEGLDVVKHAICDN